MSCSTARQSRVLYERHGMILPDQSRQHRSGTMLVIYTGGTFGMLDCGQGLESSNDLEVALSRLVADADPAADGAEWKYLGLQRIIDSADADLDHALAISRLIRENTATARGVVVVHGTDTLAYSSAVTAFMLADSNIPVIFTGSQRPISETGSDAPDNFIAAYREALLGLRGVRIVFGGKVIPAVRALKVSSFEDEAFTSFRPEAPLRNGTAHLISKLATFDTHDSYSSELAPPEIGLIRVFPGLKPDLLKAAAELYPAGIVLECYGAGTAPTSTPGFREAISSITTSGIPIVAITQCHTGSIELSRYAVGAVLHAAGAWDGHDLTADAAVAKLGVLTALGLSLSERRAAFAANLVGEQRSH